jgi:hypothetical protein
MQFDRLRDAEGVLVAKLTPFPQIEIEEGGMEANSPRNWLRIRNRLSGKRFTFRFVLATDFLTVRFDGLLARLVQECGRCD